MFGRETLKFPSVDRLHCIALLPKAALKPAVCCCRAKRMWRRSRKSDSSRAFFVVVVNQNCVFERDSNIPFSGSTPLHCSAFDGHLDVCRLLVASQVDVAARSRCCIPLRARHFPPLPALPVTFPSLPALQRRQIRSQMRRREQEGRRRRISPQRQRTRMTGASALLLCRSHVTRHASRVTRHTSHVTRHTSHDTRHTSHDTRHKMMCFSWDTPSEPPRETG